MFKVEKSETINKTFRFPLELYKNLQEIAKSQNISLNKLVVQCCQYALKNIKND